MLLHGVGQTESMYNIICKIVHWSELVKRATFDITSITPFERIRQPLTIVFKYILSVAVKFILAQEEDETEY